jgi:hypothetical protein
MGIGHWGNHAIHILRDRMAFVKNICVFLLTALIIFYTPFGFVNWFELVIVDKYCLHTDKLMLGYGSNVSYLLELIFRR